MLYIVTLICALLGLLGALALEAWLRSRIVRNDTSAGTYAELKSRNKEFWSTQYLPFIIVLVFIGTVLFVFVGHIHAAVFLGGAVLCFASVAAGSLTVVTGSISSSSIAVSGDIRNSMKTAYRSGAVMGLSVTSIALMGLGVMFYFLSKNYSHLDLAASFALGATVATMCLGLSGTAFSGAYALTVKENDFTDYTGLFIGSGADQVETYILSACSAALLAGVAVDTSGVMSTFEESSAILFPLTVFAGGIISSAVGIMTYRGYVIKRPAAGLTIGLYAAAVLISAVAVYFSNSLLQSYVYGLCVVAGLLADLIAGEAAKLYSADGPVFRRFIPDTKKIGASRSMIFSLSIGMISVIIPAALASAAMIVAFNFASYYGIALAAVGMTSMSAVSSAVRGFSINTASASEIASVTDPDAETPAPADVLLTASARSDATGKTYPAVSTYVTLVAMFTAVSVVADTQSTLLLSTDVYFCMTLGAVMVFVCAGFIIRSIRLTSQVLRTRLSDANDPEKRISALRGLAPVYMISLAAPFVAGATGGVNGLIAFSCSAAVTGMCVIFTFNNAGKFYDRIATETLGNVIKFMVAVTLVFAPLFMKFGGIF